MKNLHRQFLLWITILLFSFSFGVYGQSVGINTTGASPDPSAILDLASKEKGLLVPRMLAADRIIIPSPVKGLLVYQTDNDSGFYYYDGAQWNGILNNQTGSQGYVPKFASANSLGNSQIFDDGSRVGLGTASPSTMSKFHVSGVGQYGQLPYYQSSVTIDGGANQANVSGLYAEGGWRGVFGRNPGTASGTEAIGVLGRVEGNAYTSFGYGVKGEAAGTGPTNIAVAGIVTGPGIAGKFDGGSAGYGVIVTNGLSGFGTVAPAAMVHVSGSKDLSVTLGGVSFTHQALLAQTSATATANQAAAIVGYCANSTYENHGVHAFARGTGSAAYNVGTFSIGTSSVTSAGNSYGVYGSASSGANNYGIYGTATGTGYAGYFSGSIYGTTASAGVKAFKIDDPRDPANKYLYHSSIESNDMMDIYKGHITTNANGEATVTLPSYFNMLNKDYDYQLTCIGQFAQAIVSEEISNNQFKIKTDKPNVKVSWLVSGVRQDPVANAYRIVAEVEKPASEKGTYLQPEVYGFGPEKSLGYLPGAHQATTITTNTDTQQPPVNNTTHKPPLTTTIPPKKLNTSF